MKFKLLLTGLIFSTIASAQTATCTVLRNASAYISVRKQYWEQDSGNWVRRSQELANSSVTIPVYDASNMSGCTTNNSLHLDNVTINGATESLNIYTRVSVYNNVPTPYKIFTGSYWTSAGGGNSAWSSARTKDLGLQNIGVDFGTEKPSAPAYAHDDRITVAINFTDANTAK